MVTASLMAMALQVAAGMSATDTAAREKAALVMEPPRLGIVDCMAPLARDRMDVGVTADCVVSDRGRLEQCALRSDSALTPRQETAAQCMTRLYRISTSDGSSPAGRPVTVPIRLRMLG